MKTTAHIPILLEPIAEALLEPFLKRSEPHTLLDCTLGGGGHTAMFLEGLQGTSHQVLAVDQDPRAIAAAKVRFEKEIREGRLELLHSKFGEVASHLKEKKILGMLADLGFSSDQLDDAGRGLSFQSEGPLDMRLDSEGDGETAAEWLAQASEEEMARVFHEYGEERFSRRIARSIASARERGESPQTTLQLAEMIRRSVPPAARYGRIHPATRCFQAIRIEINHELEQLDSLLQRVTINLVPGGRVAILSFHSLEDRKVKWAFRENEFLKVLTKKPIVPGPEEVSANSRSRSAKLRIAERN